jgi:drug/metabolite transporter (DMT)-like permease
MVHPGRIRAEKTVRRPAAWLSRHPRSGMTAGALFTSPTAVLINLSRASAGTASFYRCVLSLPFLAVLAFLERRRRGSPPRRQYVLASVAGALFAGDMLLWTQAIGELGAGLSTVLANMQVVMVPLLAWLVDRERVTLRFLLWLPVLILGVVLTGGAVGGSGVGSDPLWGTVHAVLAAVCYSIFLFLLRRGGHSGHIKQTYVTVIFSAAVVSLVAGALWYELDLTPDRRALAWLAVVAVSSQVVGWLLVAITSPRLASHVGAALLLLTPVGAVALSAVVLGERPTPLQLIGCALILISAFAATQEPRRPAARGWDRRGRS